ncbi:unnamed protein product [Amoebophrya sp. A25]|nr:unnamed protein product [Amoebophrya sp. A25]|eukprot:GSA25T00020782001.1
MALRSQLSTRSSIRCSASSSSTALHSTPIRRKIFTRTTSILCCSSFLTALLVPPSVAATCPPGAEQGCFDGNYQCGPCCRNLAVPIGNLTCWEGEIKFATCCGVTNYRFAVFQEAAERGDWLATDTNFGKKEEVCPPTHLEQCFDRHFPCERCCDTKYGPQGNPYCWPAVPGMRELSYGLCCGTQAPFDESVLDRGEEGLSRSIGST